MSDKTWKFYVAGVKHHKLHEVIGKLSEGDTLTLVPEPTNSYDKNAVKITHRNGDESETMLGYVPAIVSAEVSGALTIFDDIECVISTLTPAEKPWKRLEVEIRRTNNTGGSADA